MRRRLAPLALALLPGTALGFELDVPLPELLEQSYTGTLATTAPGETVAIHGDFLCHRRGRLLVYAHTPVEALDDIHWHATPDADGTVALEARDGTGAAALDDLLFEIETVMLWQHCEDAALTADTLSGALLTVTSVNGAPSLSALLGEAQ